MNFARAMMVVLCWLSLLSAVSLAGASVLSFPIAAFLVFTLLIMVSSGNLISEIVTQGTISSLDHETGEATFTALGLIKFFYLLQPGLNHRDEYQLGDPFSGFNDKGALAPVPAGDK